MSNATKVLQLSKKMREILDTRQKALNHINV